MVAYMFVRHIPNLMSASRFFLGTFGAFAVFNHQYLLAVGIIFIGWFTDFFDGRIARYYGVQSKFGRWIDHAADRFCLICVYLTLFPINPKFSLLAVPGILNSIIQIAFSVQFNAEVRVSQTDRVWFFTSTLGFPILIFMQLAFPNYLSFLSILNYPTIIVGTGLGMVSVVQYSKQYVEKIQQLRLQK